MFADTLTITIDGVAKVLNRISDKDYTSEYYLRGTTEDFRLRIRHTSYLDKARGGQKVDRHNVELIQTVFPIAPSILSTVRKTYIVFENDSTDGITPPVEFVLGFAGFLTSANVTKLVNYES